LAERNVSARSYIRLPELVAGNNAEISELEKSLSEELSQLEAVSDNLTVLKKFRAVRSYSRLWKPKNSGGNPNTLKTA